MRLLCLGGSSDSENSEEVLGDRFCFLTLARGETESLLGGCFTGGLGLLAEPLGRPRGRLALLPQARLQAAPQAVLQAEERRLCLRLHPPQRSGAAAVRPTVRI